MIVRREVEREVILVCKVEKEHKMGRWHGVLGVLHRRLELDITVNIRMLECSSRYITMLYCDCEGVESE